MFANKNTTQHYTIRDRRVVKWRISNDDIITTPRARQLPHIINTKKKYWRDRDNHIDINYIFFRQIVLYRL